MINRTGPWLGWGAGAVCVALAACGGGSSEAPATPTPEIRQIAQGTVKGSNHAAVTGTYSWKGIPFAAPPVGALRWKAPMVPAA